eukprot:PhM_4_TR18879/c0_g1_i1/m.48102
MMVIMVLLRLPVRPNVEPREATHVARAPRVAVSLEHVVRGRAVRHRGVRARKVASARTLKRVAERFVESLFEGAVWSRKVRHDRRLHRHRGLDVRVLLEAVCLWLGVRHLDGVVPVVLKVRDAHNQPHPLGERRQYAGDADEAVRAELAVGHVARDPQEHRVPQRQEGEALQQRDEPEAVDAQHLMQHGPVATLHPTRGQRLRGDAKQDADRGCHKLQDLRRYGELAPGGARARRHRVPRTALDADEELVELSLRDAVERVAQVPVNEVVSLGLLPLPCDELVEVLALVGALPDRRVDVSDEGVRRRLVDGGAVRKERLHGGDEHVARDGQVGERRRREGPGHGGLGVAKALRDESKRNCVHDFHAGHELRDGFFLFVADNVDVGDLEEVAHIAVFDVAAETEVNS